MTSIEIVDEHATAQHARCAAFHRALAELYQARGDVAAHAFVLALARASRLISACGEPYDVEALAVDAIEHFFARAESAGGTDHN